IHALFFTLTGVITPKGINYQLSIINYQLSIIHYPLVKNTPYFLEKKGSEGVGRMGIFIVGTKG
ncbi:hypothetical protein, partial [Dapis sp. BLCC M172]|uniref:hypothetical protein n=1 Tax=Dapis sp. BLCC M172 TaxID=2975281 RepID=UPI003CEAF3A3